MDFQVLVAVQKYTYVGIKPTLPGGAGHRRGSGGEGAHLASANSGRTLGAGRASGASCARRTRGTRGTVKPVGPVATRNAGGTGQTGGSGRALVRLLNRSDLVNQRGRRRQSLLMAQWLPLGRLAPALRPAQMVLRDRLFLLGGSCRPYGRCYRARRHRATSEPSPAPRSTTERQRVEFSSESPIFGIQTGSFSAFSAHHFRHAQRTTMAETSADDARAARRRGGR